MRFKDEGKSKYYYMNQVYVHCPKCSNRAVVDNPEYWRGTPKLSCPECHFSQIYEKNIYELELKVNCPNCASRIERRMSYIKHRKQKIQVKCADCGETNAYEPRYIPQDWNYNGNHGLKDPYFGLRLWLTGTIKGNLFWALNYEHLKDIKNYVSAKLRIRTNYNYQTMVEKLPKWIQSSKNRNDVIRLIDKLETK